MAKKLNKKVVIIAVAFLAVCTIGVGALGIRYLSGRNPETNLEKARQALAAEDYEAAERYFGRAFAYGKTDAWKIERLFEMSDFHLIHNENHEANWPKAMSCWNTVINIDTQNIPARREIQRYFYEMADSGSWQAWKNVHDNASELIKICLEKGVDVDTEMLLAHGRAALAIAQRGGTAERREFLTQAIERFETLIEREPTVSSHYGYMAEAILLRGELDAQAGLLNARDRARQESLEKLDQAVQNADNKAAALAVRYRHEILMVGNDPEKVEALRAELEQHIQATAPNADLLTVLSQAYELPGSSSAEAELNRAIEAARQAARLAPGKFEPGFRLASLLYRKGSAFDDTAAMEDAIALAEDIATQPCVRVIPGPQQGRTMAYRNALNVFLSRCYLEHALDRSADARRWIAKAEPLVEQIGQYFGSSEHMTVQQWEGILALAKGEQDRAARLLYRAYEQAQALDVPEQASSIDPVLCIVLARIAQDDNQFGLQREFLEKLFSRTRAILDKPSLILDYADIMARFQAWDRVMNFSQMHQQRYGVSARSQNLILDAALALHDADRITTALEALPEGSTERNVLELRWVSARIVQTTRQLAQLEAEEQDPEQAMLDSLNTLRDRQQQLLFEVISAAPDRIDESLLRSACIHYLQQNKKDDAVALLDAYLSQRPGTQPIYLLRLCADEPDPLAIPVARNAELQLQAAENIQNPKQRALAKAAFYRSQGEFDKSLEMLNQAAAADKTNDADVIAEQFSLALERRDGDAAEALWRIYRSRNLDGCEGNLAAAQVELLKENYSLALRRVDDALAIRPLLSFGYYLKSHIYQELDNLDTAVENSRRAIQMDPINSLYSKNHASLLFHRNSALGTRLTSEQQNELLGAITTAIVLNPNDWQLQSVYAEIISEQAPDRALMIRQQLLRTQPTTANAVMLGNMALRIAKAESDVAKRSGLIELSDRAYMQAITMDPDNEAAKAAYADFLRQTQQSDRAEELLRDDDNLLWRYYLQNAQYDKAEEILKTRHQADPTNINVLRGLVLTAEGTGDRSELKDFLDLLSQRDLEKDDELWLIQKYLDSGYAEESRNKLASFKERHPDEKLVLLLEAWSKMTDGLLNDALTLTNRYLESDMNNAGAWRLRGRIYRLMNQPSRAIEDLQRSKGLTPNPVVSMDLATLYSELRQIDAAIGELVSGLQGAQAPLQMRQMLESLYITNNRVNDLERFYTQTLQLYPNASFWPMRAGRFYLSQNQPAKAVQYLKQAWDMLRQQGDIDPTLLDIYLIALTENRQYNEAISVASEMIDTPIAAVAYAHMAQVQFKQGQRDRAETLFLTALDKSGAYDIFQDSALSMMLKTVGQDVAMQWIQSNRDTLPGMLLNYRLALHNEQFNRGLEWIDKSLALTDAGSSDWNNLALKKANLLVQAFLKTADRAYMTQAMDLFEQILEHVPNNASILNNLAYLMIINDERLDQAVQYARRTHQSDPGNPTYLDTYAFAQFKTGQYEQAKQNLLRALHLYDVHGQAVPWEVFNHLGLVHASLGETQAALENFQKALQTPAQVSETDRKNIEERIASLQQQTNM